MEQKDRGLLQPFCSVVGELNNPWIRKSRADGKKVIGFFCSYVPMELIAAAGAVPYRIKGMPGKDIGAGTTLLSTRLCTFSRNALSCAIENDYSFLDGFVGGNSCDQIRRASQNWIIKKPALFNHFLHIPRVYRKENIEFYRDQISHLKDGLEEWTGRKITDDDLKKAAISYNKARGLLRKLSDLRKGANPPLSGAEMLTVSVAFHQMPVEDFNPAAEQLLKERSSAKGAEGRRRVLLCGGELDEPGYLAFIEDQGFDVVADAVCFGIRSYLDDIDLKKKDILEAIAERSLTHFPCPHIGESFKKRWETIKKIYDDRGAEGIIFQRLTFCQIWGVDAHNMINECEKLGIPLLSLEREYGFFSTGQLKTRMQAFGELLEQRKEAV